MDCDKTLAPRSRIACKVLEQLAKRLAQRQHSAQIVGAEVRSGHLGVSAFAADLDDAYNFVPGKNWSANHFLNQLGGFAADFHAFENGGVANAGKIVDDVRPALAGRSRRNGRGT